MTWKLVCFNIILSRIKSWLIWKIKKGVGYGWDGWMASPTWWTRVWVNSGSWWWTGRPGVLQFMESQRVGHDWATELNWPNNYNLNIRKINIGVTRRTWRETSKNSLTVCFQICVSILNRMFSNCCFLEVSYIENCWVSPENSLIRVQLCNPMDCSPPGSSVYGIFQARILGRLPFPPPEDLPDPGIEPMSPVLQTDSLPLELSGKPNNMAVYNQVDGWPSLLCTSPPPPSLFPSPQVPTLPAGISQLKLH